MLDRNKGNAGEHGERNEQGRGERGQSLLAPIAEVNQKEMSFGNQMALHRAAAERMGEATGDAAEEAPRAGGQVPSPEKPILNPFRIRDTVETRIVPEPEADDKIYLRAPNILKASKVKPANADLLLSNSNTDGVFYTDRDSTSARHRVDFDLDSSGMDASSSFV